MKVNSIILQSHKSMVIVVAIINTTLSHQSGQLKCSNLTQNCIVKSLQHNTLSIEPAQLIKNKNTADGFWNSQIDICHCSFVMPHWICSKKWSEGISLLQVMWISNDPNPHNGQWTHLLIQRIKWDQPSISRSLPPSSLIQQSSAIDP